MKKLQTETSTTGRAPANVHDCQSGVLLGTATADWDAYRLWASGPSDTVEAGRVLADEDLARLNISADDTVFLLDAPNAEPEYKIILTIERGVGHLPFAYCLVSENVDDRTDYEVLEEGRIDLREDGDSERLDALREQADAIYEVDNLVARTGKCRVR